MVWRMSGTFAEKFEEALQARKATDKDFGLRTLARILADGDLRRTETIRRRLHKYRPKPGGGAAEVAPTEPTRREIERALGVPEDALAPEEELLAALSPLRAEGLFTLNERAFAAFVEQRVEVAIRASREAGAQTKNEVTQ